MNASHYHPHSSDECRDKSAVIGRRGQDFPPLQRKGRLLSSQLPEVGYMIPEGSVCSWHPAFRAEEPLLQILTFVCSLK